MQEEIWHLTPTWFCRLQWAFFTQSIPTSFATTVCLSILGKSVISEIDDCSMIIKKIIKFTDPHHLTFSPKSQISFLFSTNGHWICKCHLMKHSGICIYITKLYERFLQNPLSWKFKKSQLCSCVHKILKVYQCDSLSTGFIGTCHAWRTWLNWHYAPTSYP